MILRDFFFKKKFLIWTMLIGLTGRVKQHECEVGLREPLLLYKTFQTIENSSNQLKIWAEKKNE